MRANLVYTKLNSYMQSAYFRYENKEKGNQMQNYFFLQITMYIVFRSLLRYLSIYDIFTIFCLGSNCLLFGFLLMTTLDKFSNCLCVISLLLLVFQQIEFRFLDTIIITFVINILKVFCILLL